MARYFLRFPDAGMRHEAQPMLNVDAERYQPYLPVSNRDTAKTLAIADLSDEERQTAENNGCKVYEDVQFYPVVNPLEFSPGTGRYWQSTAPALMGPQPWQSKSVKDVMKHIHAPAAWGRSRGAGVTIGIVDTGVSASMSEFPVSKQSPFSKSFAYASPWVDVRGHGSMCACAAAAADSSGGRYNGVAPDAMIMSLRTTLSSIDIYKLYDYVIQLKQSGAFPGPVVMSNSYGLYVCSAPATLPQDHPYLEAVQDAVSEGIPVFFAAGNNHAAGLCNNDPSQCDPNTIWAVNSIDEVMSIGTVNWDSRLDSGEHSNSSRGPGQWAVNTSKPDCVAPTYGEIIWGSGYQKMEWWGTSGACPQAAGLAALMLALDTTLSPNEVYDKIRNTCDPLAHHGPTCVGSGMINCEAAVNAV